MTKTEYNLWIEETKKSENEWRIDLIHSTFDDCLFYKGGTESGQWVHIYKSKLALGTYQYAIPSIGDAQLTTLATKNCVSNFEAWRYLLNNSGVEEIKPLYKKHIDDKRFLI
jgi:hypothetical protein